MSMPLDDISNNIYNSIKSLIGAHNSTSIHSLVLQGNEILTKACKKNKCFVLHPLVVSPNGIVGSYVSTKDVEFDKIADGDVLKIDFAIGNDKKECSFIGRTVSNDKNDASIIKFLDKLEKNIKKQIAKKKFDTNDELSLYIQRKCIENECEIIENCKSYMYSDQMLFSDDNKYIICNYKKYYDNDDLLIDTNDCFDFESGEVYNINISVVKSDPDGPAVKYKEFNIEPGLAFFNNNIYKLKLKSSREFYSKAKTLHGNNVFFLGNYTSGADKLGRRECLEHCILEYMHPVICNRNVYSTKFTVTF